MHTGAHRCAPLLKRYSAGDAHARPARTLVHALPLAWKRLPARLTPCHANRANARRRKRERKRVKAVKGARWWWVYALRPLLPLTNPTGDARDREAWEISGISNVSKVGTLSSVPGGVFVVFQVSTSQALNRFIACPLPRAVYYFTTSFLSLVVSGDGLLTFPFSSMCIFSLVVDTR